MLSAGFEHGGNITLRFFDGHPELYVYPFESQLGNRNVNDFLSSFERIQYRYPEFPMEGTPESDYELFYDEELKTLLRKPNGSKFKHVKMDLDENVRKSKFVEYMKEQPRTRANIVKAFFIATFEAWKDYKRSGKNHVYVGYSPIIGIDSDRILYDFPDAHIIHVVRNQYSAYSDTKRRPFPLPLKRYVISYNLYHHVVLMHKEKYPENITILRYEDLIESPEMTMKGLSEKIGIEFDDCLTYPSWNGKDISEDLYPWGTINKATSTFNKSAMDKLSKDEKDEIKKYSSLMLNVFKYQELY